MTRELDSAGALIRGCKRPAGGGRGSVAGGERGRYLSSQLVAGQLLLPPRECCPASGTGRKEPPRWIRTMRLPCSAWPGTSIQTLERFKTGCKSQGRAIQAQFVNFLIAQGDPDAGGRGGALSWQTRQSGGTLRSLLGSVRLAHRNASVPAWHCGSGTALRHVAESLMPAPGGIP